MTWSTLKHSGEPALRSLQENSRVGDSHANGAAARAVLARVGQVCLANAMLELRLGYRPKGSHGTASWLMEHSADLVFKYTMDRDSRMPHGRRDVERVTYDTAVFCERVNCNISIHASPDHGLVFSSLSCVPLYFHPFFSDGSNFTASRSSKEMICASGFKVVSRTTSEAYSAAQGQKEE